MGGWGVWVSIASYDSGKHLTDYQQTTTELATTVESLKQVEIGLAEQRATSNFALQAQGMILDQILAEVRAD
jgi:hypothetical protein